MQNTIRNPGGVSAEKALKNEIVILQPKPTNSFGRWKPTIYWYTPILMVLAAVVLVGGLMALIRKLARSFEKENWSDEVREQSYSARPFSSGEDSTGAGPS
ncbi:MAG: hypothetical protein VCD16_05620 [Planctomycetota bacterium]